MSIPGPENPVAMPRPTPSGTVEVEVGGLGTAKGFLYPDGVRQVWGIPYGRLPKRWTVPSLASSWDNSYHDGTKYGAAYANPPGVDVGEAELLKYIGLPHLPEDGPVNELESLVLNVTAPPKSTPGPVPVMIWIHGGSFVWGGSNHPGYDLTNNVIWSVAPETPVVTVSLSYRVGYGGFLASKTIQDELAQDGHYICLKRD